MINKYNLKFLVRIKSYLVRNKQNTLVNPEISQEKVDSFSDVVDEKINSNLVKQDSQSQMLKEIEEYIEKNMAEMHKALEELKISFEDEINSMDGIKLTYNVSYVFRKSFLRYCDGFERRYAP